jgi:hypothetical protein
MFKLAKIALFFTLLASTEAVLADDVYRCGKVYQDSPCAGGNSRPMNEKPFRPSINQQNTNHGSNHTTSNTTSSENKPHAKPKKMLSKRKPVAAPEPTEAQVETTQNTTLTTNTNTITNNPTAAAQAVMAPAANPAPATDSVPAANSAPAKVVDKPIEAQPAQKTAEKEVVADEQGVCSSLKAGLKNIAEQKAKSGNTADLKQQQKNLESAKQSAGC